ncbi:hypothetical protein, partial [Duganella sp. Leaf126]|uniref:hypothetical protein n=1 Tax=Duganella sp. Leaf126 TaxID=1736266 RepID=UPI001E4DBA78
SAGTASAMTCRQSNMKSSISSGLRVSRKLVAIHGSLRASMLHGRRLIKVDALVDWALPHNCTVTQLGTSGRESYVDSYLTKILMKAAPLKPTGKASGTTKDVDEWIAKSVAIANSIALQKWERGERQITARNICDAVAIELAKGEPDYPQQYHGNQGPRAAGAIRNVALKGWKFTFPSGTSGISGIDDN